MKVETNPTGDLIFTDSKRYPVILGFIVSASCLAVGLFQIIHSSNWSQLYRIDILAYLFITLLLAYFYKMNLVSICRFNVNQTFEYEVRYIGRALKGKLSLSEIDQITFDESFEEDSLNTYEKRLVVVKGKRIIPLYFDHQDQSKHIEIVTKINTWLKKQSITYLIVE